MAEREYHSMPEPARFNIAFIDLEASGLGPKSWPVEVGWAFADGPPTSILIRPDENWPVDAWDDAAEALHGLDQSRLKSDGMPARDVCAALNSALAGRTVYSDAPDWDGFWLFRLFSTAGVRQQFAISDFAKLVRSVTANDDNHIERANRLAPRRHRAGPDALHLQTIYKLAANIHSPRLT